MTDELVPAGDLPPELLALLAASIPSAPRGGVVRLSVVNGGQRGTVTVDVEEARAHLGLDSTHPQVLDADG